MTFVLQMLWILTKQSALHVNSLGEKKTTKIHTDITKEFSGNGFLTVMNRTTMDKEDGC